MDDFITSFLVSPQDEIGKTTLLNNENWPRWNENIFLLSYTNEIKFVQQQVDNKIFLTHLRHGVSVTFGASSINTVRTPGGFVFTL